MKMLQRVTILEIGGIGIDFEDVGTQFLDSDHGRRLSHCRNREQQSAKVPPRLLPTASATGDATSED